MTLISTRRIRSICAVSGAVLLFAACADNARISSQSAPQADLTRYHTYGFMEKLSTDTAGYTSITTQIMKEAAGRELQKRGFAPSDNPDVLVNFIAVSKDKVESRGGAHVGVTYGAPVGWGRHGWGVGVGVGDTLLGTTDIRSVREDTLTVDLVDREKNGLIWSGSAVYRPTQKDKDNSSKRINDAVGKIFARYPGTQTPPAK